MKQRCQWAQKEVFHKYHDKEWGKKIKEENTYFEFLILEGAQAGLSWETILKRRDGYRRLFKNFDPKKVSKFTSSEIKSLMKDERIIRNRLKIKSAIQNAKAFLQIQKEFGSFHKYVWGFVNNKQIKNCPKSMKNIPTKSKESDELSKDLKKRGFSFVGTTIIYAFMQAVGLVDDHEKNCYKSKC